MSKRSMKRLLAMVLTMAMIFVMSPKASAAGTETGNSGTREGAEAYTLTVNQEYVTALNGVEGYVSFVTPEQEGFVLVSYTNKTMSGTHVCYITDAAGKEIGKYSASYGDSLSLEFKSESNNTNGAKMATGTRYYIQIGETDSQPNGIAAVSVKFFADDCPEGKVGAREVSTNTVVKGRLDASKSTDNDWYTVTAAKTGQHRIILKNISLLGQVHIQMYDETGDWMKGKTGSWASAIAYDWGNGEASIDVMLEAGRRYYLEVRGQKGEYSFNVNCQTVESISVESTLTMEPGDRHELKYTLAPETAFNQQVGFESSNTDVAIVNENGEVAALDSGKAVITLTAKDGGGATAQCVVYVKPEAPEDLTGSKSTLDTIKLKWSGVKNATGYRVYQKKNGKWVKLGSTKNKTYTVKKLKNTTGYQFKVQAYMEIDGKTFISDKSDTAYYATKPKTTSITRIVKTKKKKQNGITYYYAKVNWKKISGVKEYRLYGKLASTGKTEYIGTYKGSSAEVVLMYARGSKKCTFYIQPVFTYKNESYYGAKSKGKVYTFK